MRYLVYNVRYSVVSITSSQLTITFYASFITTITFYSSFVTTQNILPFMTIYRNSTIFIRL